jgi:hypothetical protein
LSKISILSEFRDQFSDRDPESISPEEVLSFLVGLNDGCKQLTKHPRYSYLKAFFNFIRNNLDVWLMTGLGEIKNGLAQV